MHIKLIFVDFKTRQMIPVATLSVMSCMFREVKVERNLVVVLCLWINCKDRMAVIEAAALCSYLVQGAETKSITYLFNSNVNHDAKVS